MVALEALSSLFYPHLSSSSFKTLSSSTPRPLFLNLHSSTFTQNLPLSPFQFKTNPATRKLSFIQRCTAVEDISADTKRQLLQKRKLCVVNLPWSLSVVDIKNLFGQCGTVADVEIIKQKNGRSRGFAFVTMNSPEEAQMVIDKFDSQEVSGRIIKVEFAKAFKKPSPPLPPGALIGGETRHKLYVSNLAWKVRSTHLRDFFAVNFNPISSRVVFDSPTGRSSGYGFVSFATKEEAEAAVSTFNGKELMGRPISLKISDKKTDESESKEPEEENSGAT
ncbi:33 kDa ribonucleoprotein, chloroplastic [Euphorbia lathyris]|uniref:33 kDa ribonucleoprotein, chloroplastic n=1 Tax=Euphorbia lathyris TaxID=212925 RepID=UPI003313FD40